MLERTYSLPNLPNLTISIGETDIPSTRGRNLIKWLSIIDFLIKNEKVGHWYKGTKSGRPHKCYFFVYFRLFKQTLQFLQQKYVKKCYDHPLYGDGIRTHDFWNMSLLLLPLDQGSRPKCSLIVINNNTPVSVIIYDWLGSIYKFGNWW